METVEKHEHICLDYKHNIYYRQDFECYTQPLITATLSSLVCGSNRFCMLLLLWSELLCPAFPTMPAWSTLEPWSIFFSVFVRYSGPVTWKGDKSYKSRPSFSSWHLYPLLPCADLSYQNTLRDWLQEGCLYWWSRESGVLIAPTESPNPSIWTMFWHEVGDLSST